MVFNISNVSIYVRCPTSLPVAGDILRAFRGWFQLKRSEVGPFGTPMVLCLILVSINIITGCYHYCCIFFGYETIIINIELYVLYWIIQFMNVFGVDSCHIPSQHCPFTGVFSLLPRSLSFEQKARLELGMATLLWSQSAKDNDTVFLLMFNLEQALNMSCLSSAWPVLSTVPFIYYGILWTLQWKL